jgi:hypothetical protein
MLDHPAAIHHRDAVGHLGDHAKVVSNQQQRQIEAGLQLANELQHLRLDGDVERRRRLVGDDERRPAGEGDGDHHALPHAPGKLVRVVADAFGGVGNADRLQQLDGAEARVVATGNAVDGERFGNLIADAHHWIEGRHRLLEDERDAGAAHFPHFAFRQRQEVAPFEDDASAGDSAWRLNQPQDREGGDRFAAAGLTDDAERLAAIQLKADMIHRGDRRVRPGEGDGEILDVEQHMAIIKGVGGHLKRTVVTSRDDAVTSCRNCPL